MIDINAIVNRTDVQNIISAQEFYFQKGQDALKQWLDLDISDELRDRLSDLSKNYRAIRDAAVSNPEVNDILQMLYRVASYCDKNAKDKNLYNEYDDKRVLAMASVRMYAWINHLIKFKFNRDDLGKGSTKNAFTYLLNPVENSTVLSERHRELIANNLLKIDYNPDTFVSDLKNYFVQYNLYTTNESNYTFLLSWILYSIQAEWKEEVVALMASDGTGWQDDYVGGLSSYDFFTIWNSKRPSGTTKTLDSLRRIVEDGGSFNLYYVVAGMVRYKAIIADFAESQQDLDNKRWDTQFNVLHYNKNLSDYSDENKSAKIVFLAQSMEKIQPIPLDRFEILNDYDYPRQDNVSPIKKEPIEIEIVPILKSDKLESQKSEIMKTKYSLNQILFGPPGTGKTYNTINKALEILKVETDGKTRKDIKKLFDKKVKEGQIVFTTFHQSMSYEDFIEGIKPIEPKQEGQPVTYKVVDGIFKEIVKKADENYTLGLLKSPETDKSIPFDIAFNMLKEKVENAKLEYSESNDASKKGHPIKLQTTTFSIIDINGASIRMRTSTGGEQNTMTQGTLKLIFEDSDNIEKYVKGGMKGYYKALVEEMKSWDNDIKELSKTVQSSNYVLIIDEINRGNVSQIFGELITLIEKDKRIGKDEALKVILPYSKTSFGVPPNLYIIGTMNTADRSVEALDTALRRRFSFEEMPPKPNLLDTEGVAKDTQGTIDGIKLSELLTIINKRIEVLLDKDHQIGHSYFMTVGSIDSLKLAFYNNIIPLLQEYFFGDYGKIGLVLGEVFFENKAITNQNLFAKFERYDSDVFGEKEIFHLKNVKNMSTDDFVKAINALMNKPNNEQNA